MTHASLRVFRHATPLDFILAHQVFTLEEFEAAYREMKRSPASAQETLSYHVKQGRLCNVRRGLYAHLTAVDPWLLACKLTEDAVVSHDGALSFHGYIGLGHRVTFKTARRTSVAQFNEVIYQPLRVSPDRVGEGLEEFDREGQRVFVTRLEYALVDCLALLERSPPVEELLQLFKDTAQATNPGAMIRHALTYGSPLLISRLGFFLHCSRDDLSTPQRQLINGHSLQAPAYFLRSARTDDDTLVGRWNLIVPPQLRRFLPR